MATASSELAEQGIFRDQYLASRKIGSILGSEKIIHRLVGGTRQVQPALRTLTRTMPHDQELRSLPHGPEFRFIEKLIVLEPGVSGSATYLITGEEPFLKGHFPGNPLWPGVLMIEAIAQLGGVIAQSDPAHEKLVDLRLTSVKNAKILGTTPPGALLTIEATVEGRMGNLVQIKGSVSDGETKLASVMVMLSGNLPA